MGTGTEVGKLILRPPIQAQCAASVNSEAPPAQSLPERRRTDQPHNLSGPPYVPVQIRSPTITGGCGSSPHFRRMTTQPSSSGLTGGRNELGELARGDDQFRRRNLC
jgi:hypothetical protein